MCSAGDGIDRPWNHKERKAAKGKRKAVKRPWKRKRKHKERKAEGAHEDDRLGSRVHQLDLTGDGDYAHIIVFSDVISYTMGKMLAKAPAYAHARTP